MAFIFNIRTLYRYDTCSATVTVFTLSRQETSVGHQSDGSLGNVHYIIEFYAEFFRMIILQQKVVHKRLHWRKCSIVEAFIHFYSADPHPYCIQYVTYSSDTFLLLTSIPYPSFKVYQRYTYISSNIIITSGSDTSILYPICYVQQ